MLEEALGGIDGGAASDKRRKIVCFRRWSTLGEDSRSIIGQDNYRLVKMGLPHEIKHQQSSDTITLLKAFRLTYRNEYRW